MTLEALMGTQGFVILVSAFVYVSDFKNNKKPLGYLHFKSPHWFLNRNMLNERVSPGRVCWHSGIVAAETLGRSPHCLCRTDEWGRRRGNGSQYTALFTLLKVSQRRSKSFRFCCWGSTSGPRAPNIIWRVIPGVACVLREGVDLWSPLGGPCLQS